MSLNRTSEMSSEVASLSSLTPSIIATPAGEKSFSPTGTPLNSPAHTPPGTPPNEPQGGGGLVTGFFSSLKAALYGEQLKETHTLRRRSKKAKVKRFGILEKVEEVGVENLMSNSPAPPFYDSRESSLSREDISLYDLNTDKDELEDIEPGTLTLPPGHPTGYSSYKSGDPTVGQLTAPAYSVYGRPSLSPLDFGQIPQYPTGDSNKLIGGGAVVGGRGPGRVIQSSPGEKRPQLLSALGVPGTPGTGALRIRQGRPGEKLAVRKDLGSVPVTRSPESEQPSTGFIGSIASMFFGRKGGLL